MYFVHKSIISGERKHSTKPEVRDANMMLRMLLSEGRIDREKSHLIDAETHEWVTIHQTVNGPVSYAESTTAASIFDEDLNRRVEIRVDDSEEQNRRVMDGIAARYAPKRPKVDEDAIIKRHHEFQQHLQNLTIPRIDILYWWVLPEYIPEKNPKCRRAIVQVFSMVEVEILLHLHDRLNEDGVAVATLDDYAEARRMLIGPICSSLGMGPMHEDAQQLKAKFPEGRFNTTEIRNRMAWSPMKASRTLKQMEEAEIIICVAPGRDRYSGDLGMG